jgi:hypothetical protein
VRRHLVALAAFLMQPHPPAFARGVIILDLHADDGADARGICMGCSPGDRGFADSQLEQAGFEPLVPLNEHGRIVGLYPLFMGSGPFSRLAQQGLHVDRHLRSDGQAGEGGPPAQSHKSGVVYPSHGLPG